MKIAITLMALLCSVDLFAGNIVKNGSFETGIEGWHSSIMVDHALQDAGFISAVTDEGARGTASSMRVVMEVPEGSKALSHNSGVVAHLTKKRPEKGVVQISFYAKRVSGSPILSIRGQWGGTDA
jgi:hypothetical protein